MELTPPLVGADHSYWRCSIGHFGVSKLNINKQWLIDICSYSNLCITNTFFTSKPHHRVHQRTKQCHQLDFIITRRAMLNYVLLMPSYHSADCDTDHILVGSKVRLCSRQIVLEREATVQQHGQNQVNALPKHSTGL